MKIKLKGKIHYDKNSKVIAYCYQPLATLFNTKLQVGHDEQEY